MLTKLSALYASIKAKFVAAEASLVAAIPAIKSHSAAALVGAAISVAIEWYLKF